MGKSRKRGCIGSAEAGHGIDERSVSQGATVLTKQQKINIQAYYDPKPIPIRRFDWEAVDYDTLDYDSVTGFGATKEEAIADLMERLDDIE